jgi:TDG/mug DNA glycosylase family protein
VRKGSTTARPSRTEIAAARGRKVPDLVSPGLRILFVGINPSLYSGAVGFHFARPGNRFWPALRAGGFTDRVLDPSEGQDLLERGYGITSIVDRATASAAELADDELITSANRLKRKVRRLRPAIVAFLGVTAYRAAFRRKDARLGRQPDRLSGSMVWVLPNPSGLNAHHQLADLGRLFAELRRAVP